ncbi:uncharacterized protein LOC124412775 [Diprion similis]|uniref:uncharacterized protein LOC124412775 n=1 Tax=Diprion similis TaxID=362088 RepID=UPI001EF8507A|nr:uncharacterized protein LOC124412775 [Diprion similis]
MPVEHSPPRKNTPEPTQSTSRQPPLPESRSTSRPGSQVSSRASSPGIQGGRINMADLAQFKTNRKVIKGQLTRITRAITGFTDGDSLAEVEARVQKLRELWDKFDTAQTGIEQFEEPDPQNDERASFETAYFKAVASAKQLLAPLSASQGSSQSRVSRTQLVQQDGQELVAGSSIKLPTLNLPKFDGHYAQWLPFRDTFEALIDKNESLSDIQKFYYLRSSLQGVASQVIHSLETSAANYVEAWNLLKARFENKRLLIHYHVQGLFEMATIPKESASQLRKLLDDTLKHLRALKTLGQPTEQWDSLIIHMMASKLDPVTRRKWETNNTAQNIPTFDELSEFLTQHCAMLETLNPSKQSSGKNTKNSNPNVKKAEETISCISSKNESETKTSETKTCPTCQGNHSIYHCSTFKGYTTQEKWNEVKRIKVCFNCLRSDHTSDKCRSSNCKKCNKKHNTLLHIDEFFPRGNSENTSSQIRAHGSSEQVPSVLSSIQRHKPHVMLSTALITIYDKFGNAHVCRAVLDSGSQSNLLTKALYEKLQLKKCDENVALSGINLSQSRVNGSIDATIKSRINEYKNINLADPTFNVPGRIDVLLGAGVFWQLLCVGQHVVSRNQPLLHKTKLGWIVSGNIAPTSQNKHTQNSLCFITTDTNLQEQVERFWKIEEYSPSRKFSDEEKRCEEDFRANYRRDEEGRFTVALSFRDSIEQLGESRDIALRRLYAINRKLEKQPQLKAQYHDFMNEYITLGHMSEIQSSNKDNESHRYYIPHHAVLKESSLTTKLRVVFDASCKTSSGKSLNDILRVGPTIQQELFAIVTRFRQHQHVVTADITKMYRQVNVRDDHRDLQRILWRSNVEEPVKEYRLNTVTYGTATAPFLAIRSLQQLAYDNEQEHPECSEIILRDFYVDDLLTGGDDVDKVKAIKDGVNKILLSGGFSLRQWTSNTPNIIDTIDEGCQRIDRPIGDEVKTLGLFWNHTNDTLRYKVNTMDTKMKVTKRSVLSLISQIYDPLGLVGPACIKAKIVLQQLWRLKIGWDESLPSDLHTIWRSYYNQLSRINDISIPRVVVCANPVKIELHGFCDASESAYGACVYVRSSTGDNEHVVELLCAKARVAPLKTVTLPKLELCGAVLLARLVQKVTEALTLPITDKYYWCDSQVTLGWIAREACNWKTFVANRVAEIQERSDKNNWHHVRSEDNPADVISRGINPDQLQDCSIWWNGPQRLSQPTDAHVNDDEDELDDETIKTIENESKPTMTSLATVIQDFKIFERYSSLRKLTRVVAYCKRFVYNTTHSADRKGGPLSVQELREATTALIKLSQAQTFAQELQTLSKKPPVHHDSKLASLNPFIDEAGVIRVGGRLQNTRLPYAQKFPVVLAPSSVLTRLIIRDMHLKNLHAGPQALLNSLNETYWILSARSTVRSVLHKCITCFRLRPKNLQQIMGNLPSVRVNPGRAFLNVGVDYGGPFSIKLSRNKTTKAYLCLFVCLVTRAIHLELASDLTTNAFLNALKRFTARRGKPANIYSDNGTNFTGANNELKALATVLQDKTHQQKITNYSSESQIQWHFIPPYSPHMGGMWEAGIKSAKTHLKRVLGNALLTFEEFYTTISEIEACLNSRPITPMSNDPSDLTALSPGHFLIGAPLTALPHPNLQDLATNRLTRYQVLTQIQQHFWSRWSREYLTQLQARTKWRDENVNELLKPDTLVILKDDKLPPLQWKLGRITETHAGKDGHVRVVSMKTSNGIVQRGLPKICILPIET